MDKLFQARRNRPHPPAGGPGLVRGPALNIAAFFLLGNDFITCYNATLICLCACVCVERCGRGKEGGGV